METPLDPINICLLGGYSVGKTSLFNRLTGSKYFESDYKPSNGVTVAKMVMNMKNDLQLQIRVIDVSAEIVESSFDNGNSLCSSASYPLQCIFRSGIGKIDGSFVVLDCFRRSSFEEAERCIHVLDVIPLYDMQRMLFVNKADFPKSDRAFSTQSLDNFCRGSNCSYWGYVVAHNSFGDFDSTRGDGHRQQSPEDMLNRMIMCILKRRDGNVHKLIDIPLTLQTHKIESHDYNDLQSMWGS